MAFRQLKARPLKLLKLCRRQKPTAGVPKKFIFSIHNLSLGQIYSALAYYYDHSEEFEREIKERLEKVKNIRAADGESKIRRKLKEKGLL